MDQSVLVTGGAGYIGSHTCKLLKARGYQPIVIDNLVYGHEKNVQWGPLYKGDIQDEEQLLDILTKHKPRAVIHFAAYAYVGESVTHPEKYYLNNVAGTLSLLKAMDRCDCRQIIFSSSCATYGIPETVPISEKTRQNPVNPYGWSKLMVEQILKDYGKAYGIDSVSLRYFNAAGADLEGGLGEEHLPETHLIPLTIFNAMDPKKTIEIYGDDYPTEDGTAVRDYIHVIDLADAHVRCLELLAKGNTSEQINLGTGKGISVREIVTEVGRVSGREIIPRIGPRRAGDPPILVADAAKAKSLLGWSPKYSDIETIISSAWKWHCHKG